MVSLYISHAGDCYCAPAADAFQVEYIARRCGISDPAEIEELIEWSSEMGAGSLYHGLTGYDIYLD